MHTYITFWMFCSSIEASRFGKNRVGNIHFIFRAIIPLIQQKHYKYILHPTNTKKREIARESNGAYISVGLSWLTMLHIYDPNLKTEDYVQRERDW